MEPFTPDSVSHLRERDILPTAVIGISGPIGSGKSWFCGEVLRIQSELFNRRKIAYVSTSEVIWILGAEENNWYSEAPASHEFKKLPNGRERLIEFIEDKKREDPYIVPRYIVNRLADNPTDILILDCFGFAAEQKYIAAHTSFISTIVLLYPHGASKGYRVPPIGRRYEGDSRSRLAPRNGWNSMDSNTALQDLKETLAHAKQESIFDNSDSNPCFTKPNLRPFIREGYRRHVLGIGD